MIDREGTQRELAMKIVRDAEREIRELYPRLSGHNKRKRALALAERRMRDVAAAGEAEKLASAVTGTRARIVID